MKTSALPTEGPTSGSAGATGANRQSASTRAAVLERIAESSAQPQRAGPLAAVDVDDRVVVTDGGFQEEAFKQECPQCKLTDQLSVDAQKTIGVHLRAGVVLHPKCAQLGSSLQGQGEVPDRQAQLRLKQSDGEKIDIRRHRWRQGAGVPHLELPGARAPAIAN